MTTVELSELRLGLATGNFQRAEYPGWWGNIRRVLRKGGLLEVDNATDRRPSRGARNDPDYLSTGISRGTILAVAIQMVRVTGEIGRAMEHTGQVGNTVQQRVRGVLGIFSNIAFQASYGLPDLAPWPGQFRSHTSRFCKAK